MHSVGCSVQLDTCWKQRVYGIHVQTVAWQEQRSPYRRPIRNLHPVAARAALFDFYVCSITASLFPAERNRMLNAEPNTTLEILSENGAHHTSIVPALPSSHHPSPHRPGRLTRSESAVGTSSAKTPDPWAITLAAIHQFSAPPDPMRNYPDLSSRPASAGEPLRPRETDGTDVRAFTVTI